jgi:hypothetical protein
VWFQSLPEGDVAVGYWEGDDPRAALKVFASSEDPLDEWLKKRGREAYQFEPDQPLSISSLPRLGSYNVLNCLATIRLFQ